jgi:hypothetical protein
MRPTPERTFWKLISTHLLKQEETGTEPPEKALDKPGTLAGVRKS